MIANLKREILELKKSLDAERGHSIEPLRERTTPSAEGEQWEGAHAVEDGAATDSAISNSAVDRVGDAQRHTLYELKLCKRELEDMRESLHEAFEEREALRVKLSECQIATDAGEPREAVRETRMAKDSHPHLDWVGRHYLAVSLPEDRMFKPDQSVTPVGVLQKLFEMRVGDKPSTGFSVLLENINIMLSGLEPKWYAKHFGSCRTHVHGNKYKSTDRVDTEDFAWLLFEYGARAPLIVVLAGLLNVLNSMSKGGVTAAALHMGKTMCSSYVTLFRDSVARAYEGFRAYARELRVSARTQGRGIEAPRHIGSSSANSKVDRVAREDPIRLEQSLSAFMRRRSLGGHGNEGHFPYNEGHTLTSSVTPGPLEKRVLFDSPWLNNLPHL
ncbi:hypothetical protein DPEC_G00256160 [Dallia pectoralis]|uniref:Uncharacterized protein n=1 Tax=Dallia pectoralis TaxID=75939 RepID=A0ACC2FV16_DALPE|nr:hypothetical protein DPEC_G00256160 [Dallia pectoralis]